MDDKNDYEESATTRGDQSPIDLKKSAPSNEEFTSTSNSNRLSSLWAVVTKIIDLEEEGINPITNRVTTAFEFYSCFSLWFSS